MFVKISALAVIMYVIFRDFLKDNKYQMLMIEKPPYVYISRLTRCVNISPEKWIEKYPVPVIIGNSISG